VHEKGDFLAKITVLWYYGVVVLRLFLVSHFKTIKVLLFFIPSVSRGILGDEE